MLRSLSILLVSLVLTSCATTQPAPEAAELEVQQASDRFWAARQSEDIPALTEHLTEDAILMIPGLPDAEGRAAIGELLQKRFATGRTANFKVFRREIQVVGDTAYELAWFSDDTHHEQADSFRMEGRYLTVWQRGSDGRWRVHRNFYNFSGAAPISSSR